MSCPPNPMNDEIKALHRELIWEALGGVVIQLEGAQRFLVRGDDKPAADAMRRAHGFFKEAATRMNAVTQAAAATPDQHERVA